MNETGVYGVIDGVEVRNGPYVPKTAACLGSLTPERVRSVRETGFLPGNNMGALNRGRKHGPERYMTDIWKIMRELPVTTLRDLLKDDSQPIAVHACAAHFLLAASGDTKAMEMVLERTEGKVGPDVEITNNTMIVNGGKQRVSSEQIAAAFGEVERNRK